MAESWRVVRMDDNGNRSVIAEFPSRVDAERMSDDMSARGQKQAYWVESTGDAGTPEEKDEHEIASVAMKAGRSPPS